MKSSDSVKQTSSTLDVAPNSYVTVESKIDKPRRTRMERKGSVIELTSEAEIPRLCADL